MPVAAVAYFFLKLVSEAQHWVFTTLPGDVGFTSAPIWWPILPLTVSGLLVGLSLRHLPGTGGHKPAEGFKAGGAVDPKDLPGIVVAAFATLSLGVVLGPEAPLIAIGSGLGVLAVHLLKRDAPKTATMVIGAAGSFAAISTLLGSPLVGAFLLMEASGIGGPMLGVVLVPGLLAAGIGTLIFVGLDNWTGYGTFSLAIPNIPAFTTPTLAEFLWAIAIGVAAAVLGIGDPPGRARAAAGGRAAQGAADAARRARHRRHGGDLRRADRPPGLGGALLGSGRAARADRGRGRLDGRRARPARGLQGASPTASRSRASAAARCSRACSSARPAGSRSRTCPACR